jgi:hypothetical protein
LWWGQAGDETFTVAALSSRQSSQVSVIYDRIKQERDAVGDGRIGASNLDFLHRAIDVTGDYLEVMFDRV